MNDLIWLQDKEGFVWSQSRTRPEDGVFPLILIVCYSRPGHSLQTLDYTHLIPIDAQYQYRYSPMAQEDESRAVRRPVRLELRIQLLGEKLNSLFPVSALHHVHICCMFETFTVHLTSQRWRAGDAHVALASVARSACINKAPTSAARSKTRRAFCQPEHINNSSTVSVFICHTRPLALHSFHL